MKKIALLFVLLCTAVFVAPGHGQRGEASETAERCDYCRGAKKERCTVCSGMGQYNFRTAVPSKNAPAETRTVITATCSACDGTGLGRHDCQGCQGLARIVPDEPNFVPIPYGHPLRIPCAECGDTRFNSAKRYVRDHVADYGGENETCDQCGEYTDKHWHEPCPACSGHGHNARPFYH